MTKQKRLKTFRIFLLAVMVTAISASSFAAGYDNALKGVKSFDVVYEFTQENPKVANIVFWAVTNAYNDENVEALPKNVAVVIHGAAVKLISSDRTLFNGAEWAEGEKFQETLRQMKKDGVKLEICLYAAKVMGVGEDTIIPEVDRVGNGFVSVIGYQKQGYAVVRIP